MKKKRLSSKPPFSKKFKKTLFSLFVGLILSFFAWTTDSINTVELPHADQPPLFYSNQTRDDLQKIYLKAIQEAKKSILLIIYGLTDDAVIAQIKQKAEEGIDVQIICDCKASPNLEKKIGSGVKLLKRMGKGLMHLKILVIDGTQTWIGSANLTSESLKMHGNLVMAMDCPAFASAIYTKADTLTEYDPCEATSSQNFVFGDQQTELWFLPDNRKASVRIKDLIRSAKKTIKIAMFTWTRQDFAKEVVEAHKRGVHVEAVIDHNSSKGASAAVVETLRKGGVPIHISQGTGLLHHKFMLIDGKILENGSANWTKAAFTQNDDCFMILNNLTPPQKNLLKNLWKVIWQESSPPEKTCS